MKFVSTILGKKKEDVQQKPAEKNKNGEGNATGQPGPKSPSSGGAADATDATENLETPLEVSKADLLKNIESLSESGGNRQALLLHKLRLCQIMFDWAPDDANPKDQRAKEVKRQQLLELVDYIGKNKNTLTEAVLSEMTKMVAVNLFRTLAPKLKKQSHGEMDEEDPVFEPAWPHLQVVYEFFLRFIVSSDVDVKILKKHITAAFVVRLLELFDSEDHRERDYLKTILHRIYAKFMSLRAFIRKAINNLFYIFIWETERHNGIAELLEILGSIINGFALPLKEEHRNFLKSVLIPMHKVKPLAQFHQQLSYCVTQFVDKDPTLAADVISGLVHYWPRSNAAKEVLFLNELEELLELTQPKEFDIVLDPLFRTISRCIGSLHFQVAERALFFWHNEYISGLIAEQRARVLPLIYPVLHQNSVRHWNATVNNLTLNVLKIFTELDSTLVEQESRKYSEKTSEEGGGKPKRGGRKDAWLRLQQSTAEDEFHFRARLAQQQQQLLLQQQQQQQLLQQQLQQQQQQLQQQSGSGSGGSGAAGPDTTEEPAH